MVGHFLPGQGDMEQILFHVSLACHPQHVSIARHLRIPKKENDWLTWMSVFLSLALLFLGQ